MASKADIENDYNHFRALRKEAWDDDRDTLAFTYQEEIDAMERKYPWLKKLRSQGNT